MQMAFHTPSYFKKFYDKPKKYPQDIQCVLKSSNSNKGSIYISNIQAAQNSELLKRFQIKAVLSCAKGYSLSHPSHIISDYKYIPTQDCPTFDLRPYFQECIKFIKETVEHTNVLVHCIAGVSRSVSMVIAYLISEKGMRYEEAYHFIKTRRRIINPNSGFIHQLKQFQRSQRNHQNNEHMNRKYQNQIYNIEKDKKLDMIAKYHLKKFNKVEEQMQKNKSFGASKNKVRQKGTPRSNRPLTGYQKNSSKSMDNNQHKHRTSSKKQHSKRIQQNAENSTPNRKVQKQSDHFQNIKRGINNTVVSPQQRKGYFYAMNDELSRKIQAIKQKYDKKRKQLLDHRYKKINNNNTPQRHRGNSTNDFKEGYSDRKKVFDKYLYLLENRLTFKDYADKGYNYELYSKKNYLQ